MAGVDPAHLAAAARDLTWLFPVGQPECGAWDITRLEPLENLRLFLQRNLPVDALDLRDPKQLYELLVAVDAYAREDPETNDDNRKRLNSTNANIAISVGFMIWLHGEKSGAYEYRWSEAAKALGYSERARDVRPDRRPEPQTKSRSQTTYFLKKYLAYSWELLNEHNTRKAILKLVEARRFSLKSQTARIFPPKEVEAYWEAGWGPERETFTVDQPATYPSFNSIIDNPDIGDERSFVGLRHLKFNGVKAVGENIWNNHIWARAGDTLLVRIYVNNVGADNFDVVAAGHIQQARLRIALYHAEREHSIFGELSAVNAKTVWDGATVHVDEGVGIEFVSNSLILENNVHPGPIGLALDQDAVQRDGVLLGYQEMDGAIRPGYQYDSYISIELKVTANR